MPLVPFIPLIAAGVGVGGSLLTQKSANNQAQKALDQQKNDPLAAAQKDLITHQTDVGKFGFDQAKALLPQAKEAIDLPFSHFKSILSGNPDEFNKVLAGSNQAVDQQTQSARQNIVTGAPRGAVAGKIAGLATQNAQAKQGNYFQAYINALGGVRDSATQYGNLFGNLLSSGANAGVPALNALTSLSGFQTQQSIASQQLSAQAMSGLGTGIGQILTQLMTRPSGGNSRSGSTGGVGASVPPLIPPGVYQSGIEGTGGG